MVKFPQLPRLMGGRWESSPSFLISTEVPVKEGGR